MAKERNEITAAQLLGMGMQFLDEQNLRQAHDCFQKAFDLKPEAEILPAVQSYLGYTLVILVGRESEGFRMLHNAVTQEFYRADFFVNLGRAYWQKRRDRKQALNAFFNGLRYCPGDATLLAALKELGTRRKPALRFLARGNFLNRWLGRRSFRKNRRSATIPSSAAHAGL